MVEFVFVVVVVVVVAVDAALAFVFADAFDVAGVRLVLLLLSILSKTTSERTIDIAVSFMVTTLCYLFFSRHEEKQQSTATRVSAVPA